MSAERSTRERKRAQREDLVEDVELRSVDQAFSRGAVRTCGYGMGWLSSVAWNEPEWRAGVSRPQLYPVMNMCY